MNVFFFLHRIDTIKIMWTKKETYKMALRPCTSQLNFQTSRSDRSSSKTLPLPTVEAGPKQDLNWYVTGVMRATYIYILLWKGENKREGRSGRWEVEGGGGGCGYTESTGGGWDSGDDGSDGVAAATVALEATAALPTRRERKVTDGGLELDCRRFCVQPAQNSPPA